jgi:hypothetical protein
MRGVNRVKNHSMSRSVRFSGKQLLVFSLLVGLAAPNFAWADQTIRNLKRPLQVKLETAVKGETATVGQPFAAQLAEPVHYQNWTLPSGTHFQGHITAVKPSRHFGRPGYVILQTDSAVLPDGQTVNFDPATYTPRHKTLRDPSAETFWQSVAIQLPYSLVSMGVTLPLYYAADVDALPLVVIGEGVRIVTGAVVGLVRPKFKGEPVPRKLALGGLDGSGVPRVVNFIGTYPEPDYHAGDTVKLYLNPQGLEKLFQSAKTAILPTNRNLSVSVRSASARAGGVSP